MQQEGLPKRAGPLVVLIVGMAGTGKSTFVQRLNMYAEDQHTKSYFVNLDPAVADVPFSCNIDIRDAVNYKEVMKQFRLGPNGAIMTSLNLFATKFHQVVSILEQKDDIDFVFVDTPGQIEVFTWSASGQLITEALSATFPTCVVFVADTPRCSNPQTFMATMLYASSIMFKSQLPLIMALNKCDIVNGDFVMRWMAEPTELQDCLSETSGYAATLTRSLSLFAGEFYANLKCVCVSAVTGEGLNEFHDALRAARAEYLSDFLPMIAQRIEEQKRKREQKQAKDLAAVARDLGAKDKS